MKKIITLSTILALSVASIAEAKGMRSARSVSGRTISAPQTQPMRANTQQKVNTQKDATFENTRPAQPANATAQQANGSRLGSFATGAAAGYMLSNMLAPSEAQANQGANQPMQAVENTADVANVAQTASQPMAQQGVSQFQSIGGQIDPYLVEKTDGYRRYCLEGVQYLAPAQGGQTTPIMMLNANGKPLECRLVR